MIAGPEHPEVLLNLPCAFAESINCTTSRSHSSLLLQGANSPTTVLSGTMSYPPTYLASFVRIELSTSSTFWRNCFRCFDAIVDDTARHMTEAWNEEISSVCFLTWM